MRDREIDYTHGEVALRGYAAFPDAEGPAPGVLVAHDWSGRGESALASARRLAALGYVGFALDMYGGGRVSSDPKENGERMGALRADRGLLIGRMQASLDTLHGLEEVDSARTGAIGFCFGGLCVLDLARSGADVGGVVSFHGLLDPPQAELRRPIGAKVLVLHGYKDPMVPPDSMLAFAQEMDDAGVDWQLHAYGQAVHAFTNERANFPAMGAVYHEATARRAFRTMAGFFSDLFG